MCTERISFLVVSPKSYMLKSRNFPQQNRSSAFVDELLLQ